MKASSLGKPPVREVIPMFEPHRLEHPPMRFSFRCLQNGYQEIGHPMPHPNLPNRIRGKKRVQSESISSGALCTGIF
jgi:hypothetical protein